MKYYQNIYIMNLVPSLILQSFLVGIFIFSPIILYHNSRYFTFFFLLIGAYCFFKIKDKPSIIFEYPFLNFILGYHVLLLIIHFNDYESVINLGSLITGYFGLYLMIIYLKEYIGFQKTEQIFNYSIIAIGIINFPISALLTYLNWPGAPTYYPWEVISTSYRFLLISGVGVGHSPQMWIMAFSVLIIISDMKTRKKIHIWTISLSLTYIYLILKTQSRIGILFVLIILSMPLSYIFKRTKTLQFFGILIMILIVYIGSFNLEIKFKIIDTVYALQEIVPYQRVLGSERQEKYFFTGRDVLNQALLNHGVNRPVFGLGDGHPIFKFGIDDHGNITFFDWKKIASSESVLNMAAKYGIPYFVLVLILLLNSMVITFKSKNKADVLPFYFLCIIAATSSGSGVFINLYGIDAVFMYLVLFYKLKCSDAKTVIHKQIHLKSYG